MQFIQRLFSAHKWPSSSSFSFTICNSSISIYFEVYHSIAVTEKRQPVLNLHDFKVSQVQFRAIFCPRTAGANPFSTCKRKNNVYLVPGIQLSFQLLRPEIVAQSFTAVVAILRYFKADYDTEVKRLSTPRMTSI